MSHEADLATQCQSVASCLSYNAGRHEGTAKHTLIEASMILDKHAVTVYRGKFWASITNARGKTRRLTWRERLAIWLLKGGTEIRP